MDGETSQEQRQAHLALVQELLPSTTVRGVLIPLKTTMEVSDEFTTVNILITRTPVKSASAVLNLIRTLLPEEIAKSVTHMRRCAKPCDLPAHLKAQFMNETAESRQIHTGKSQWIYMIVGPAAVVSLEEMSRELSTVEGLENEIFLRAIPMPAFAPRSQVQAALWSSQFWPTVYRKHNPLGPHPSSVTRHTEQIRHDTPIWMTLAGRVARETREAGYGEGVGALILQRHDDGSVTTVALAGDARWHKQSKTCGTGNPMAHAVMRAISMVGQKLVRAENRVANKPSSPILEFEAFQDCPLLDCERRVFEQDHPSPDGYLCHDLELYLTHEPCVMCSMAILHSRMGKIVFSHRMPMTGGMGAEDRKHKDAEHASGGRGLGLFWRRELNWSMMAWEWESTECALPLPPLTHV